MRAPVAAGLTAAVLALALAGCAPRSPESVATIDRIEFSHGAEYPTDDADAYVQEDPQEVGAFIALLQKYAVDPAAYGLREAPRCADDETARVDVSYRGTFDGAAFLIGECAAQDGTFEAEASALLDRWFDDVSPGRAP